MQFAGHSFGMRFDIGHLVSLLEGHITVEVIPCLPHFCSTVHQGKGLAHFLVHRTIPRQFVRDQCLSHQVSGLRRDILQLIRSIRQSRIARRSRCSSPCCRCSLRRSVRIGIGRPNPHCRINPLRTSHRLQWHIQHKHSRCIRFRGHSVEGARANERFPSRQSDQVFAILRHSTRQVQCNQ